MTHIRSAPKVHKKKKTKNREKFETRQTLSQKTIVTTKNNQTSIKKKQIKEKQTTSIEQNIQALLSTTPPRKSNDTLIL